MCDTYPTHIPGSCPSPDAAGLGKTETVATMVARLDGYVELLEAATVKPVHRPLVWKESQSVAIEITVLPNGAGLPLPKYSTDLSAGMDLYAALDMDGPLVLNPGSRAIIPAGIAIAIPQGFEGQVRSRSGLAIKAGVVVLNSPGTIDSDYRGEVGVILANMGQIPFTIQRGDRIAQLVIAPYTVAIWRPVVALTATYRGEGGFGSTGR